jgi:carboxyl-terminal processing protease
VDLRDNAGGLLDAAVEVCDLFLDAGVIVSTSGRDGRVRSSYSASPDTTRVPADVPMAVLVNTLSASASEIVAACLQDHRRAVVVGTRTWGKGTVQNIFELEGGRSALKLTTAGYLRPSGKNIHRPKDAKESEVWGVLPNPGFDVPISEDEARLVFEWRQERDSVPTSRPHGTSPVAAKSAPAPPAEGKSLNDRQLRRAIEYLEQQIAQAGGRPHQQTAQRSGAPRAGAHR